MNLEAKAAIILFLSAARTEQALGFLPRSPHAGRSRPTTQVSMGLIDDLKLIFSEEGKKNREAYVQREREEMMAAQREIIERRKDPKKMEEYEEQYKEKRAKLSQEREVWSFQQKSEEGYDPLKDWTKLREEGKIKVGSDLERDEGSRRLGSEGLVDVRVDERMPYIDQGYVDDSADFMGSIMGMFGGKKKKKDEE